MIRRTLARLTVSSMAALTLVACQDSESPLAPLPRAQAPRFSIDPAAQLDQQNLVRNFFTRGNANSLGQSITAGLSGQLTTISIQIYCGREVPDGVLEVYKGQYDWYNTDVIGFSPTAIASQAVPASVWPGCPTETPTWLDVTFDAPASVVAGQVYTFRFVPSGGANIDYPAAAATSYAAGSAFGHPSYDILFKTYVLPPMPQLDQQNLVRNFFTRGNANSLGQSITAGLSGQLTTISIQIYCGREVPDGVLEVYKGQYDWYNTDIIGFSPTPIASQPVPASVWPGCPTETPTWLDVTFDAPAAVVAGQVYTFRFVPSGGANIDYPAAAATSYAAGSAFGHPSYDILFKTYILAGSAPADETSPVVTPAVTGTLGTGGWYRSNVDVSWTVVDAESDISTSSGCESTTVSSDNAGVTFTCSATSGGGSTSQSVTVRRDATGPTLDPSVSPNPVLLNASASAAPNASDAISGLAASSCAALVTTSVGAKTVACTATDHAGNVSTQSASYTVIWPFSGFLGGISAAPTMNSVKAGTSVQLKFTLGGNRGLAIFAADSPTAQQINCGKPVDIGAPVAAGGTGPTYDAKSGQYAYAWKTEKAWAGTCRRLSVKLVDGSDHIAVFQFTK